MFSSVADIFFNTGKGTMAIPSPWNAKQREEVPLQDVVVEQLTSGSGPEQSITLRLVWVVKFFIETAGAILSVRNSHA
jgi:hypothetical protein